MIEILGAWWRSMGKWRWINLLIVGYACFLAFNYEAVPDRWINHGRQDLGGVEIRFFSRGRIVPGRELVAKLETSVEDQLSVGFESFDSTFISVKSLPEGVEFVLVTPTITSEPLQVIVYDQDNNLASWNLGRLY